MNKADDQYRKALLKLLWQSRIIRSKALREKDQKLVTHLDGVIFGVEQAVFLLGESKPINEKSACFRCLSL